MKFQKTLVAVAIAGIAAVPAIASADTTLSGVVQIQISGSDADSVVAVPDDPTTPQDETVLESDPGDPVVGADDVLFGITSEHELNSGLTGYGSLRVDINRLSNEGNQTFDPNNTPGDDEDDIEVTSLGSADSIYVGIRGGFGNFRFGEVANGVEVGQVANDIYDVASDTNGGFGYSGNFGPVGVVVNYAPENNEDVIGGGVTFGLGGFNIGLGAEQRGDDEVFAGAVGATFAFAGASIGAHYWTRENGDFDDTEVVSAQIGYGFAGISAIVTGSLQMSEGILDGDTVAQDFDDVAVRLDLVYDLGGGMDISSRLTNEDNESTDNEVFSYRVKLSKAF